MINWAILLTAAGLFNGYSWATCCGPNEYYKPPGSYPLCDNRCDKLCESETTSDCFCVKGYARDSSGKCIPKDKCPPMCRDPNEMWYPTCNAPKCEQTCSNWGQACEGSSHAGCFCGNGYARSSSGNCIKTQKCFGTCPGAFELFLPYSEVQICTFICTLEGEQRCVDNYYPGRHECFCSPGFLRAANGNCILFEDCKPTC